MSIVDSTRVENILLPRYMDCCTRLGATQQGQSLARQFSGLMRRYNEPGRHYHTPLHLLRAVVEFDRVRGEFDRPHRVLAAIFYAQSVSHALPQKSAAYWKFVATDVIGIEHKMTVTAVAEMIALSGPIPSADRPSDRDTALFLDIELAIVGADARIYDAYRHAMREEYRHVYTDDQWAMARIDCFLDPLLQSKTTFLTPEFESHYGENARANMMEERVQLQRIISR